MKNSENNLPSPDSKRVRVALIMTRTLPEKIGSGRERILAEIHRVLHGEFDTTDYRIKNLMEVRKASDFIRCVGYCLWRLLTCRPIPMQVALYSAPSEINRLSEEVLEGRYDVVYVDSVRCQVLIGKLRSKLPPLHIVSDFDDLMSRRAKEYLARRIPLSLGFLRKLFPKPIQNMISGPFSGILTRYEFLALKCSEQEIARKADVITLISSVEKKIFELEVGPRVRARIRAIPPQASFCPNPPTASAASVVYRFVFVGSDQLVQNQLSIDYLVGLWERLSPVSSLHIYGRQIRSSKSRPNVHWHGFVQDINDVYSPGSILALPVLMPGGIKTKIIEAWSFGCPVLANPEAFEGLDIANYPMVVPLEKWHDCIMHPESLQECWIESARLGNDFVRSSLSPEKFAASWRDVIFETGNQPS